MRKKKIILAMIEAGGGHKSPAEATREALEELSPDKYQISVPDFAHEVGAIKLDENHKKQWHFLLENPAITMTSYYVQDTLAGVTRRILMDWMKEFVVKGAEWLRDNPPDVFISYHFMNTAVAIEAKKKFNLSFPIATYLTEPLDAHAMWVWPDTDIMMVSSATAKYKLIHRGFPGDKIIIVPYPVRPSFFHIQKTRKDIQSELNIDTSKTTILMSSGAEGLGRIENYSMAVVKEGLPVNLIVVCGRNDKLKSELDRTRWQNKSETNLIPLGYVTNMNELLLAADIVACKASPGSTFEALLMNKLPIHMQYVTPSEQRNTDFIKNNKIGWYAPTKSNFVRLLKMILDDPKILSEYKSHLKEMHLINGAYEIAKIVDWLAFL